MIKGLRVNGRLKRLFFVEKGDAEDDLKRLQTKQRRSGEAGLNISDELRVMAAECAKKLDPFNKTISDATRFYIQHLSREQSAHVDSLIEDYLTARRRTLQNAKHESEVRARLARFAEAFPNRPVKTISSKEIEAWLYDLRAVNGNKLEPQTVIQRTLCGTRLPAIISRCSRVPRSSRSKWATRHREWSSSTTGKS